MLFKVVLTVRVITGELLCSSGRRGRQEVAAPIQIKYSSCYCVLNAEYSTWPVAFLETGDGGGGHFLDSVFKRSGGLIHHDKFGSW